MFDAEMTQEEHLMVFELAKAMDVASKPRKWHRSKDLENREYDFVVHLMGMKKYQPTKPLTEKQAGWLRILHYRYVEPKKMDKEGSEIKAPKRVIDL